MQKLSKFTFFLFLLLFLHINYYILNTTAVYSQEPFPKLKLPCNEKRNIEFHSLRPYQAAHCGDANKALYCSNDLKFLETFDVTNKGDCTPRHESGTFLCNPDFVVDTHTLIVDLDDSMFPIMGNTEDVKNSQNNGDVYDDATKVNEYASWYLSGVNNRAEYDESTDDRTVNYSGPIQKLLPKMIQEAERINTINKATINDKAWTDDDGKTYTTPQNHDQVVVCSKMSILWLFGQAIPEPCYNGSKYRLSDWNGDLSGLRSLLNLLSTSDAWNKRTPPLPWDDGSVENPSKDNPAKPFASDTLYQKAYNEWQGKSCLILPIIGLQCIDNPLVTNTYADLYSYIPLSNTTDKKGNNYITDVQPDPVNGTLIEDKSFQYGEVKNAPLYFAHTQEVKESSELLNKTFTPLDCPVDEKGKKIPDEECKLLKNNRGSVEKNDCSVVDVRVNKGDNLFPGDPDELQVPDVTYVINQAKCKEVYELKPVYHSNCNCWIDKWISTLECTAQVYITILTKTKTPNADEIFDSTVAGTGSTFRKIFPKVEENAPVSCIADIPTVTDVTYDASGSQPPAGGDLEFTGVERYPEDGAGDNPQLTFPHIGSVYEYFLKGIQTALRPKGYGEPIVSGKLCNNIKCGELGNLPQASSSCRLGGISSKVGEIPQTLKDIVSAAAETYKVPPNLILGIMYGESAFNKEPYQKYEWTEENVKNWATCEPLPNCSDALTSVVPFTDDWSELDKKILPDLQKINPDIKTSDPCNLMHSIFALASSLNENAGGGSFAGNKCFGITMTSSIPTSCDWQNGEYESSIKMWENGNDPACFTRKTGCMLGDSVPSCSYDPNGDPDCEVNGNHSSDPSIASHNACVWDVAHGN